MTKDSRYLSKNGDAFAGRDVRLKQGCCIGLQPQARASPTTAEPSSAAVVPVREPCLGGSSLQTSTCSQRSASGSWTGLLTSPRGHPVSAQAPLVTLLRSVSKVGLWNRSEVVLLRDADSQSQFFCK